tara:strand:- start:62829 stop:63254 length:426 start_codon:yes stop_codon:yes gene_type:complete
MKISKRQLKRIIKEEYNKLKRKGFIRESAFHSEDLAAQAEEAGIYHKDWYDIPGFCESALAEGLISLELVDVAAEELNSVGVNDAMEAILNHEDSALFVRDLPAVKEIAAGIRKYKRGKFPMHPRFPESSYTPMIAWIASR